MGVSAPTGLSARVRRALGAGKSKEDVVRELVAEGLSHHTAEHFVERALREPSRPASSEGATTGEPSEPAADSGGRGALVSGAFWFSLGCTVTGVTYLLASPGQKYLMAYGAVLAGLLAFGRGFKRWWEASQPFPWMAVFVAAAVPPAAASALVGAISWHQHTRTGARRAEEAGRLEEARAVQDETRAASERKASDEGRAQRHAERVARARERLQDSSQPMTRCEAALDLGQAGAREAIHELIGVLQRSTEHASVRNCSAAALVKLGETEQPLAFYLECARAGTSELRRIAIGGFKDIGPPAAEVALPYVSEALRSPHWDLRYLAVEALVKLGPLAEPLLREATLDTDERVRQRAAQALGSLRR